MKVVNVYVFDDKTLGATVSQGALATNGVLVNLTFEGLHIAVRESDLRDVLNVPTMEETEAMNDDRR